MKISILEDVSGTPITSMGASWESRAYVLGNNNNLCVHLAWDNIAPVGTMYLDYSGDPLGSIWEPFNTVVIDGSFSSHMFLDSNIAVAAFRIRYDSTSGTANITLDAIRN